MICFDTQGHASGVNLYFCQETKNKRCVFVWEGEVDDNLKRQYADFQDATEFAATAIAVLLIREFTDKYTFERSMKGTNVDYFLTEKGREDDLVFNKTARLEVSGILAETKANSVKGRIKKKINRLRAEADLPNYIIVVEFSRPWAKMETVWAR
jgi:hypothetical protein